MNNTPHGIRPGCREFEMLAFGKGGELPLVILSTSFGRYYQNEDFGLVGSVSAFVASLEMTERQK